MRTENWHVVVLNATESLDGRLSKVEKQSAMLTTMTTHHIHV